MALTSAVRVGFDQAEVGLSSSRTRIARTFGSCTVPVGVVQRDRGLIRAHTDHRSCPATARSAGRAAASARRARRGAQKEVLLRQEQRTIVVDLLFSIASRLGGRREAARPRGAGRSSRTSRPARPCVVDPDYGRPRPLGRLSGGLLSVGALTWSVRHVAGLPTGHNLQHLITHRR